MKKSITVQTLRLITPFLFLAVLLVLWAGVLNFGISKVKEQQSQIATERKNENVLKTKEAFLRDVEREISNQVGLTLAAIPEKNPVLIVISQLKNLASQAAVSVSNVKAGAVTQEKATFSKVQLSFDVEGTLPSVLFFAKSINGAFPLMTIQKMSLNQSGGVTRATISLNSYWAPFPEKLPPVTEALKTLSSDEVKILTRLSGLTPPPYLEVIPGNPVHDRNPFD